MSASGPSDSTTTQTSDSYNNTTNKTVTLSDVGNNAFTLTLANPGGLNGLPSIGTILPIAAGILLIGCLFIFKK